MNRLRFLVTSLAGAWFVGGLSAGGAAQVPVMRCGWFSNPTPANAWLVDREAEWTIGIQGGPQAKGDWPTFKPSQWVQTNGHHGYGCACMSVVAKSDTHEFLVIKSVRAQSLSVCRSDRLLKAPR